jgi:hypothetical protein
LNSSNKSQQQNNTGFATVRITTEDAMWWVRNGFMGYYMGFEKSMARYLQDRVAAQYLYYA